MPNRTSCGRAHDPPARTVRRGRCRRPFGSGSAGPGWADPSSGSDGSIATWTAPTVDVIDRHAARDLPGAVERLAVDLLNAVRGEVRFDAGSRAAYSTDASNYRQVPIGVVVPHDPEDVVAAVEVCRAHDVPIVSRGGGTSLAGQTCNVAVVLDHSKANNRLLELNADEGWARVQPGLVLDGLRATMLGRLDELDRHIAEHERRDRGPPAPFRTGDRAVDDDPGRRSADRRDAPRRERG